MVLPAMNVDDPDVRRAEARRSRDNERVKKLHDGRLRNNGADIIGIKNQIVEKEARAAREAQEEQQHVHEQESIRRYISRVEADEAAQRHEEAVRLRQEWLSQSLTRGERREADIARKEMSALNVDDCSVASAQKFDGEDLGRHERRRLQASQVREWTQSQIAAKNAKASDDKERDRHYDETMRGVSDLQQQAEADYERERAKQALEVRRYNEAMANALKEQGVAQHELNDIIDRSEILATVQSDFLSENALQAKLANPNRVRVDHWKGLSKDEVKKIVLSNNDLLTAKQKRHCLEKESELLQHQAEDGIRRQLIEIDYDAEKQKAQTQLEIQQTLKRQALEAKEREKKQKEQSQGKIEKSFFNSFGRSFR
ncbi:hypothetical protein H310_11136 [Aphanomyces invadans]|uniref:RIB43A-like with coiled-coils protein 2 n=1 Tax=Aphanomyces invadans TaxID=157072 RepID=A0A024TNK0_9STRA|nr:hypothetical protein H310_11136 [Aphanomyces invadans]ETV95216.1 hypothetical protein H310_11136 [Aphanomyces invadans]|eukprot:XP_008875917.1 hypothetical protein H310_11136 [Aphanomyces invadans]